MLFRSVNAVGKDRLVLDLSCKKQGDDYYIVTDRWQCFTEEKLSFEFLDRLSESCAEFLVHAADVEGKSAGIEEEVVRLLGSWGKIPVTYAGGISSLSDIEKIRTFGDGRLDFTIGSALDLFGGPLKFEDVLGLV